MRRNLKTIDGTTGPLSYRITGHRNGPAIILIHGAVGDSRLYRHQLRYFGSEYTTIAIDLPGHGRSYNGAVPSLDDYMDAIESVLLEEGIGDFVSVGHSMGGGVALELYRRHIPGMKAMALVSTAPVLPVAEGLVDILERDDTDSLADLIVGSVFSHKVDLLIGFARKGLAEMDTGIIKNDVKICKEMDYTGILDTVNIPVLVVANSGDAVISCDRTVSMGNKISGAKVVVFDHQGHVPFFENSREFNAVLEEFLAEIGQ